MFLGIDLGTASVKALLLSEAGLILNEASENYDVTSAQPAWAETDPRDWWQATCKAVKRCCKGFEVEAISFSGQMHGTVLCDAQARPLRPAILWADTRAIPYLEHYQQLSVEHKTHLANPIITGMMGVSLLWLRAHEPDSYQRAQYAIQPKDWLRFQFCGNIATDPSDASATLLYDFTKNDWAYEIIDVLDLRADVLAEIQASQTLAGELKADVARSLGLQAGIPIVTGGADAACSAFGSGLTREGQVQINIGTAMQIFAIREQAHSDSSFATHLYRTVEDNYYAMAAMKNAGLAFEWVRRVLKMSWAEMYQEAFSTPAGAEGLIFLPYLTGENSPHFNPHARGTWHNLGLQHSRGHMVRAVFEGIAFALNDGLLALERSGIVASELRLAGGGTGDTRWQQLLADVLGKPLMAVDVPSASAKGAALLAANARGYHFEADSTELVAAPQEADRLTQAYHNFTSLYGRLYTSDGSAPAHTDKN